MTTYLLRLLQSFTDIEQAISENVRRYAGSLVHQLIYQ